MANRLVGIMARYGLLGCVIAAGLGACGRGEPAPAPSAAGSASKPVNIVATIAPVSWPARAISTGAAGVLPAKITVLVPPGDSEHGFELTPEQMSKLASADMVLMVGLGLEPKVQKALDRTKSGAPNREVVRFEDLGEKLLLHQDDHDEDHGAHAHHDDGMTADPHLWLDPEVMKKFTVQTGEAWRRIIARRGGDDAADSRVMAGVALAASECDSVEREYQERLKDVQTRVIVSHHNAYSYLARRFGLEVAAVVRPVESSESTPGELSAAVKAIQEKHARAVFVEPQLPRGGAESVARAAGVPVLPLDPLGDGDWPKLMRANLDTLVRGLGGAVSSAGATEDSMAPSAPALNKTK